MPHPLGQADFFAENFALQTWQMVVPADGRTGDGFAPVVEVGDDASPIDQVVGYTGRQP